MSVIERRPAEVFLHRRSRIFLNHGEHLPERRQEAFLESGNLATSIIIVPFILISIDVV